MAGPRQALEQAHGIGMVRLAEKVIDRGGLVAIGTDGRCSNPDLSVWNELLFLHSRFPDCDPALLLQIGTISGARALGWEAELGTIEAGKRAEATVMQLGDVAVGAPYAELFHPDSRVIGPLAS